MRHKRTPTRAAGLAKITRPRLVQAYVRTRLFRQLDRARKCPAVWVTASPGAGKTMLAATYVEARRLRCLWYEIDTGDNDVATFFHYLGLAVSKAAPRRRSPLPALTPEYLPGLAVFARRYFENVYARLKAPAVLVLDNYHLVAADSPLHAILGEAIAALPARINIIVLSRSPPPPALARLHANNLLAAIDVDALRLTPSEVTGIARLRRPKARLSRARIEQLHEQTQGWTAGLVLLLEREGVTGAAGPANGESTTYQPLFDYFAAEIFEKTDNVTQDTLLKTAILPRITAEMAGKLTGHAQAGRVLAELQRRNYFTTRHADTGVYRYHPLFHGFLLARLHQRLSPVELSRLRHRAAQILEDAGHAEDAVELYLLAGDWAGAARLIVAQAGPLLTQGRYQTLEQWLGGLPPAVIEDNPWLLYWLGMCHLPFHPAEAREHFETAFRLSRDANDPAGTLLAWSGAVDAIAFDWSAFTAMDPWIDWLDAHLRTGASFPNAEIEARVATSMAWALTQRRPDHPAVHQWVERSLALTVHADASLYVLSRTVAALYHGWAGSPTILPIIEELRVAAGKVNAAPLVQLTCAWAEAAHEWLRGAPALAYGPVQRGLRIAEESGVHIEDHMLLAEGATACLADGRPDAADGHLRTMLRVTDMNRPFMASHYYYLCAWQALLRNDATHAHSHAQAAVTQVIASGAPFAEAICRMLLARALIEQGSLAQGEEELERAGAITQRLRSPRFDFMIHLWRAYAALAARDETRLAEALRVALAAGSAHHEWCLFGWDPAVMARLCMEALARDIEPDYVRALIRKRNLIPADSVAVPDAWPWPIRIHTLGRYSVLKDDMPIESTARSTRKPLELLAALIALGGRGVSQEKLIEALWPEAEGDVAQQAFETTLHRLRKLLDIGDALVLKDCRLTLDAHRCWVDCWALERALHQSEQTLAGSAASDEDIESLTARIFALHQGPFLGTEADRPWALSARERLRGKLLRALERLGRYWEAHAAWDKAATSYARGLEVEPLAEELYRALMRCYQRQGHFVEACAVYARCRKTLAQLLNMSPSPETEALHRELQGRQTPSL